MLYWILTAGAMMGGGVALWKTLGWGSGQRQSIAELVRTTATVNIEKGNAGLRAAYSDGDDARVMPDKAAAPSTAAHFYDVASDLTEYGLGASIHMSQGVAGCTWREAEIAHEVLLAGNLRLRPGMHALDVGCGLGGPMRTVVRTTGARVTGITISGHQVTRVAALNAKAGITADQASAVHGNYLDMRALFCDGTFDAAWAIESTCYAPTLEQVYAEIFRVLKPGGVFLTNEFVLGPGFDPRNARHVHLVAELCRRSGLPELRPPSAAEAAGRAVGFEVVSSVDMVAANQRIAGTRPWYRRFEELRWHARISRAVIALLDTLRLLPRGLNQVHADLVNLNEVLIQCGRDNLLIPMHWITFRKP
jgi:24-methylenesterol C-methyltransferase